MRNTIENQADFLAELVKMANFFSDAIDATRQETYWELIGPDFSLEEWRFACREAKRTETFHKVPLPGVLIPIMLAHRKGRDAESSQRARLLDQQAIATPKGSGDPEENRRNVAALIASVWPGEAARAQEPTMRSTLHQAYRAPSQRDPEARKAELRAQLEQLEKEQRADGENDVA